MGSEKQNREDAKWVEAMNREGIDQYLENARRERLARKNAEKIKQEEERKRKEDLANKQRKIADARAKVIRGAIEQSCPFGQSGLDISRSVNFPTYGQNNDEFGM